MKNRLYIIASLLLPAVMLASCQKTVEQTGPNVKELSMAPSVEQMKNGSSLAQSNDSRAVGDDFFTNGSQIEVNIALSKSGTTPQTFTYAYGADRIFRGNPGYRFVLDDTYITSLTAKWPTQAIRDQGIRTDQRKEADYKAADWMSGGVSTGVLGIVPTDAPVPLVFTRENILIDFELVGQNTTGLNIEELLIELRSVDNDEVAYWAYCENPDGHAELIVPAGTSLFSSDNYLIGRVKVTDENEEFTIIFPQTNLVFQAGHRYRVTLTPQGYFMNAYVYISGFAEGEGGIGIPFQPPTPNDDGNFAIDNAVQLITMSYLMRHYNDGTTYVWSTRNYVLSDALTVTREYADRYIPIPRSLFTGTISSAGQPVESVPVSDGSTLELFDNAN